MMSAADVPHPVPPAGSPQASSLVFSPAESEALATLKSLLPGILAALAAPAKPAPAAAATEDTAAGEAAADDATKGEQVVDHGADDSDNSKQTTAAEGTPASPEPSNGSSSGSSKDAQQTVSIWGVPLVPESGDIRVDVVLIKFLRARENDANAAAQMLEATLRWRREFNIDELLDEKFPEFFDTVGYIHGHDATGHPVVYNVYGGLNNAEVFGNLTRFLRWRVQLMERAVRLLDFQTIDSITNIHDYANVGFFSMDKDTKAASKAVIQIMSDNYPELLHRKFL